MSTRKQSAAARNHEYDCSERLSTGSSLVLLELRNHRACNRSGAFTFIACDGGNHRFATGTPPACSLPEHRQRFAEYEAIIVRRADVGDLIVIQEPNATAAVLDAATRTLLRVRAAQIQRREPDGQYKGRAAAEVTIGVRRSVAPADWQRRNGPKAEEVVKKLKAAPYRSIDGFGQVRALSFYPPRVSR